MLMWSLFFVVILCGLLACAWFAVKASSGRPEPQKVVVSRPVAQPPEDHYSSVLKTLKDVFKMGDLEFEKFSAALIIAKGEGHTFYAHSGGKRDQ
jgi:hypothetical protein